MGHRLFSEASGRCPCLWRACPGSFCWSLTQSGFFPSFQSGSNSWCLHMIGTSWCPLMGVSWCLGKISGLCGNSLAPVWIRRSYLVLTGSAKICRLLWCSQSWPGLLLFLISPLTAHWLPKLWMSLLFPAEFQPVLQRCLIIWKLHFQYQDNNVQFSMSQLYSFWILQVQSEFLGCLCWKTSLTLQWFCRWHRLVLRI